MNLLSRIAATVLGLALLVVAMVLYTIKPELEAKELDPIRTTGPVGEEIATPAFSVKATRVDVAKSLKSSSILSPKIVPTNGVFVIVQMEARSNSKPFPMNLTHLEAPGGYSFQDTDRTGVFGGDAELQPLIWSKAVVAFEIPKNRLAGATVVLRNLDLLPQLSSEIAVDLGITEDRAAELIRGAAEGYEIPRIRP